MDSELGINRKSKPLMVQDLCVSLLRDNYKLQIHLGKSISVISLTSMKRRISLACTDSFNNSHIPFTSYGLPEGKAHI